MAGRCGVPWLFNMHVDGVVREVNTGVQIEGLTQVDGNGKKWNVNHLLFANDMALVVDTEKGLQKLVTEFVCKKKRKLRVNVWEVR